MIPRTIANLLRSLDLHAQQGGGVILLATWAPRARGDNRRTWDELIGQALFVFRTLDAERPRARVNATKANFESLMREMWPTFNRVRGEMIARQLAGEDVPGLESVNAIADDYLRWFAEEPPARPATLRKQTDDTSAANSLHFCERKSDFDTKSAAKKQQSCKSSALSASTAAEPLQNTDKAMREIGRMMVAVIGQQTAVLEQLMQIQARLAALYWGDPAMFQLERANRNEKIPVGTASDPGRDRIVSATGSLSDPSDVPGEDAQKRTNADNEDTKQQGR